MMANSSDCTSVASTMAIGTSCRPARRAGEDLVGAVAGFAHDDRLDDAALLDRLGQFDQVGFGKGAARIARIGLETLDRRAAWAARRIDRRRSQRNRRK